MYPSRTVPEMPVPTVWNGRCLKRNSPFRRRDLLSESLVRAMPVVVVGVTAKDALEVAFVDDQQAAEACGCRECHPWPLIRTFANRTPGTRLGHGLVVSLPRLRPSPRSTPPLST